MTSSPLQSVGYFPHSPIMSPAPPSSVRSSSAHSADSRKAIASADYLATQPPSPEEKTDLPPFVPSPDDHISLNQFDNGRGVLYERENSHIDARSPRLYRRSTSSIQYEPLSNYESLPTYRRYFEPTYRGRLRMKEWRRRRRRPTSAPGNKAMRLLPGALLPTPADGSLRTSESGEMVQIVESEQSNQPHDDAVTQFQQPHHRIRAETHPGIPIPFEIRLRRASDKPVDMINRRESLQGPRPTPLRQSTREPAHPSSHKGILAGEALTQAYVHTYSSGDQSEERRSSMSDGTRRLSATLQVVRSRDSVYEVIWEDIVAPTDTSSTTSSSSSSSPGFQLSAHLPYLLRSRPSHVITSLASWSWGGEMNPYSNGVPPNLDRPGNLRRPSMRKRLTDSQADHSANGKALSFSTFESGVDCAQQSSQSVANSEGDGGIESRRRSLPTKLPRPPLNPTVRHHLTLNQRHDMLGNRKLSNLPPDQEHFTSHRDSLILAHERIFFNSRAISRAQKNPQIQRLQQTTWRQPTVHYASEPHSQSVSLRQSSLEPRGTPCINVVADPKKPRSKHSMTRRKRQREAALSQNAIC